MEKMKKEDFCGFSLDSKKKFIDKEEILTILTDFCEKSELKSRDYEEIS